jgi:SPP1 gp7 family putative phage head morphogenesis protein
LLNARSRGIRSVQDWLNNKKSESTLATFESLDLNLKLGNQDATRFIEFQSFAIATVENDRILQTLKAHLKQALSNGKSFRAWQKTANEVFDQAGISRLNPHHLETVWRTNAMLAYSAGQTAALETIKDDFPYWQYSAVGDSRTRPSHKALHGKIFKTGDYRFFPPIGFNCRCSAIPISKTKANSLGITEPSPITPDLRTQLKNTEFIGNKNESFLNWLLNQPLSPEAKHTLNETAELLLESVTERNQKDWELLLNDEDMKPIRKEYKQKGLQRNARTMGLSEDEGLLVAAYTSTKYHEQLNRYLRGMRIEKDGRPTRFWRAFKRQLQTILEKLPPYTKNNGIVYRVLDTDLTPEQQTFYIPGETLYWANFTSTNKTKNPKPYKLRFIIKSKTGRDITKLSFFFPKEKEVLIPPSRFNILEKQLTKEGFFFYLEEL